MIGLFFGGKDVDVNGNWHNWLGWGPLRQLGDKLRLFGVIWCQMGVILKVVVITGQWEFIMTQWSQWGSIKAPLG